MRILLSNDDGYLAPGLRVLYRALCTIAEVDVVAPDRDRSGASNSLTLRQPLRVTEHERGFLAVDGTPTDCVHLAITGLLERTPDVVVSGINQGANLGDDVLYSGTVAAAMEGRHLGRPAMAVSLVCDGEPQHFETASRAVLRLLEEKAVRTMPPETVLNINVPDVPWASTHGFRATRLGNRRKAEGVVRDTDPRGSPIYWVGPAGSEQDAGPGTDFHAVRGRFISVTPLHVDLTRHRVRAAMAPWLDQLPKE